MPPAKIILVLTCKRMIADWSFFFFRGARAKAKAHTQKDKEKEKKEERQASGGLSDYFVCYSIWEGFEGGGV